MRFVCLAAVLAMLAPGACAVKSSEEPLVASVDKVCQDPRPEVCTMEYVPVCATMQDGSRKTCPNGCSACADAAVRSRDASTCSE